jgi:SprT-like family protein
MKKEQLLSSNGLNVKFAAVRKQYFFRWDKAQHWACKFSRTTSLGRFCAGLCDSKRRIIYVPKDAEDLAVVLIHEICHAVTPHANHGQPWQERMLKAATVASRRGQRQFAQSLRRQIEIYRDAERVTKKAIYSEIEECVLDRPALPSFRSVVKLVAHENLMTAREFLKRFPRAKRVYDDALTFVRRQWMWSAHDRIGETPSVSPFWPA